MKEALILQLQVDYKKLVSRTVLMLAMNRLRKAADDDVAEKEYYIAKTGLDLILAEAMNDGTPSRMVAVAETKVAVAESKYGHESPEYKSALCALETAHINWKNCVDGTFLFCFSCFFSFLISLLFFQL